MTMPRILLTDDIPTNLLLLHEFLTDRTHPFYRPYDLVTARDGLEALTLLEAQPEQFDMVLLDIMMPGLNGMEVLSRMKAHPLLCEIPVIFQTARNSPEAFATGIQAGAYYYLTKPVDQNQLLAIIRTALENCHSRQQLKKTLGFTLHGMTLLHSLRLTLRTLDEARAAAALLAHAFPDPSCAMLGILELLYNAVEHGNLGLTYEDKTRLNREDRWDQEIADRLERSEYLDRRVCVELGRTPTELSLTITDQGVGFDWARYLQFDPRRATHTHGRGIAIANQGCFDT
ncbi:MAG: response regulator, partial [Magnetococcales bacterium]|nr:response regulator [Magnetococcales bacterium]